jgi:transcriptional regulator with XRE-family HTH domain
MAKNPPVETAPEVRQGVRREAFLDRLKEHVAKSKFAERGGQKILAAEIGVDRQTLSNWLTGNSPIPKQLEVFFLLAQALGVTLDYLFSGNSPSSARPPLDALSLERAISRVEKQSAGVFLDPAIKALRIIDVYQILVKKTAK